MTNNLIVYFSHDKQNYVSGTIKELEIGNTKVIAQKINKMIESDLFEIKPLHDYPYDYYECTKISKQELNNNQRPKILNIVSHIEQYDNIYLGFPSWWGTMPMCVWTFLESYDLTNKNIYPFCTHEGSGFGNSINDLKKLCPNSNIKTGFVTYGSQVQHTDKQIKEWLKEEK